jgi:hypothetical protein
MQMIFQGISMSVFQAKQPFPETQVRFASACAGAAERPQARRVPTMNNDAILIMACPPSNAGEAITVSDREG